MQVRYIGPFADGVELFDGRWFDHGKAMTVTDDEAAGLLDQRSNWEPADDEARSLIGGAPVVAPTPAIPTPASATSLATTATEAPK